MIPSKDLLETMNQNRHALVLTIVWIVWIIKVWMSVS